MVQIFDCPKTDLKQGSKGDKVTLLQTHLKTLGYYVQHEGDTLLIDGDYGKYTKWAVTEFQKATGLTQDGKFGPITCKVLNEKITAKTATTTTSTSNTSAAKKDPYAVDKSKNQFKDVNANLNIDGLNFVISSVTFTAPISVGSWKRIDLMNGSQYTYKSNPVPKQYSVDCYMSKAQYNTLKNEFYKMMHRVCKVTSTVIESGKYTVEMSLAYQNVNYRKVTLNLTEYLG